MRRRRIHRRFTVIVQAGRRRGTERWCVKDTHTGRIVTQPMVHKQDALDVAYFADLVLYVSSVGITLRHKK